MPSSSSTSSFEFNPLERCPRRKLPLAALGALLSIAVIEAMLHNQRVWFADRATWLWDAKQRLVDTGKLNGDVALLGTSVLCHGADAKLINDLSGSPHRVVNLALNGMTLPHQTQMLARCFERGTRYEIVVLELRSVDLVQNSWRRGPYFQFWASWREWLEGRVHFGQPGALVAFAANRLFGSFGNRKSLDNWISMSVREQKPVTTFRDRNNAMTGELSERLGFCHGEFGPALTVESEPKEESLTWNVTEGGELWLRRLLSLCAQNGVKVAILQPPAPPFVERARAESDFWLDFHSYVSGLRNEFSELDVVLIEPRGYALDDFCDHLHYSPNGGRRLSEDLAAWIRQTDEELRPRAGEDRQLTSVRVDAQEDDRGREQMPE